MLQTIIFVILSERERVEDWVYRGTQTFIIDNNKWVIHFNEK